MTRTNAKEFLMFRAAGPLAVHLLVQSAFNGGRETEDRSHTRTRSGEGLFTRLQQGLKRAPASIAKARTRRRALAELSALEDRLLHDIGLQRGTLAEALDAAMERHGPVAPGELQQLDRHLLTEIGGTRGDRRYQSQPQRARAANANRAPRRAA